MLKVCGRCGVEKDVSLFVKRSHNKSGIGSWCRECHNDYAKKSYDENPSKYLSRTRTWREENKERVLEYARQYHKDNAESRREYAKRYAKENKDKIIEYREKTKEQKAVKAKIYRAKNKERDKITRALWEAANKEKKANALKKWRAENSEKYKESMRRANKKRGENIKYRISGSVSRRIRTSLSDNGTKNARHWETLVGFTVDQLKKHLEKQFKPGMTWENYGEWHIDHIVPIAAFNFEKAEDIDFKRCWALENLQPMWAIENKRKSAKIDRPFQPSLALAM